MEGAGGRIKENDKKIVKGKILQKKSFTPSSLEKSSASKFQSILQKS